MNMLRTCFLLHFISCKYEYFKMISSYNFTKHCLDGYIGLSIPSPLFILNKLINIHTIHWYFTKYIMIKGTCGTGNCDRVAEWRKGVQNTHDRLVPAWSARQSSCVELGSGAGP